MPPGGQFDIYQSAVGVTAVTNPVQRQILEALADGDLQLPEIMELTGKAKSTLSSIHMKELQSRELVEELPHPTDSRRKIYHLVGKPMRSSEVPVAKQMAPVSTATPSSNLSLAEVVRLLAKAPAGSEEAIAAQAFALGERFANKISGASSIEFGQSLARFVEVERLALHLQLDFEAPSFRCRPGPGIGELAPERAGFLLANLARGAAAANGLGVLELEVLVDGDAFVLQNRS